MPQEPKYDKQVCFCCDTLIEVETIDNPIVLNPTYGGVLFRAYGNYGSEVFDPIPKDNEFIQVVICDACLRARPGRVTRVHKIRRQETGEIGVFNPLGGE